MSEHRVVYERDDFRLSEADGLLFMERLVGEDWLRMPATARSTSLYIWFVRSIEALLKEANRETE